MAEVVEIQVDIDQLYLDDLEVLEGAKGATALLDCLDRAVIGGVRGRKIPMRELRTIAQRVRDGLMEDLPN
jgi:hypothetical protein